MTETAGTQAAKPEEPIWPVGSTEPVAFLLDAASGLEARVLRRWVENHRPDGVDDVQVDVIPIPSTRRRSATRSAGPELEGLLASGGNPILAPLRIAWLPERKADGERAVTLREALRLGDPRDPNRLRQAWILRRHPDRCRIVAGDPAPVSELRSRWRQQGNVDASETTGLSEFVVRQAGLALERAERRLRGNRYKVPRLVHEDIHARPAVRGGLARLARRLGRSEASVRREAEADLREIAAAHQPTMIDLAARIFQMMTSQAYGQTRYDRAELEGIAALGQHHPIVFMPSHKSNLDHPTLRLALYAHGLPPNHTAGGINMNFFPMGPILRRAGVFFIRRSFKDDEIYKFILRQYIDYLIEKRFPMEWYIEGGRSRSGKLLPPRFGLLAYVLDAYRRGKAEDIHLIPVSIAYDQISDVGDYAAEQRGEAKRRESFGWFLSVVRRLRGRYGDIHMRFGEPVSLLKAMGPPDPNATPNPDEMNLSLQKTAFEVCHRINEVTPITPTSLVTLGLLGVGDRALTLEQIHWLLGNLLRYVERRNLPTSVALDLHEPPGIQRVLEALESNGVVTCYSGGTEAVWAIGADQHLTAAYYRNTVIHFFVTGAIAELALLRAAEHPADGRQKEFFEEALGLRDLFKFEFFFADKESFQSDLRVELALHDASWETALQGEPADVFALIRSIQPLSAHRILRPFLEAYRLVADTLARWDENGAVEDGPFLSACLGLGKQYTLQRRVRSPESVSKALCQTALQLARNRNLTEPGSEGLGKRREAFAEEIADAIRRVDAVEATAAARRAGFF